MNCRQASALPIFSRASSLRSAGSRQSFSSRSNYSRPIESAQIQPFAHFARLNPSGINTSEKSRCNSSRISTSAKSSFFIKSLIIHDLKSIRIITRDNKPSRINTSENYRWKSLRINTSKNTPGGGGGMPPAGQGSLPPPPLETQRRRLDAHGSRMEELADIR